ncbi:MAG: hypothetical protein ABJB98_10990 [Actinomycetota bacterium]
MPGAFGTTSNDDGVHASTKSRSKSGVFGSNEAKTAPPAGSSGGAGVFGLTGVPGAAGVMGGNDHAAKGVGVQGNGPEAGISGFSEAGAGVRGHSAHSSGGELFAHDPNASALLAINDATTGWTATDSSPHGTGVCGVTTVPRAAGVFGANNSSTGVGIQGNGAEAGLSGYSQTGSGARAFSLLSNGIEGFAEGGSRFGSLLGGLGARESTVEAARRAAVTADARVQAVSSDGLDALMDADAPASGRGNRQESAEARTISRARPDHLQASLRMADAGQWLAQAPVGRSNRMSIGVHSPAGSLIGLHDAVAAARPKGNGVWGHTKVHHGSGVFGSVEPGLTDSAGITGVGTIAGQFFGNVVATGSVRVAGAVRVGGDVTVGGDIRLTGADFAEDFDLAKKAVAPPGTVMVIDADGGLKPSASAYDKAVAGVVSGAGSYRPGIVLDDRADNADPSDDTGRVTVALVGKVYCQVDASHGAVEVGDLLTTSPTPGYAMKAADATRAFGSIIGKALKPLASGQGLLPVLVALQ